MLKVLVLFFGLAISVSSFASLTVTQPVNGTTVSNPIRVVASDPEAVSFRVYVDSVSQYSTSGASMDTSLNVSAGQRNIVVQSWDRYGNVEKYAVTVTAQNSVLANKISNLEEEPWGSCGTCGNHPGDTRFVSGTQDLVYSPALNGKSSKFSIGGDNPYTNYYWFIKTGWSQIVRKVRISFDIFVPSGSDPQAIEFETQYRWNSYLYNLSIQLGYKSLRWRTFDRINNNWLDTGIPLTPPSANAWHHVEADFEVDHSGHRRKLVSVALDGVTKTPSAAIYLPAKYQSGYPNYMTVAAFQLDMNGYAQDYSVFVDNYTFEYE
jgi:hypothetical protein